MDFNAGYTNDSNVLPKRKMKKNEKKKLIYSNMNDEPIRLFHINVRFHMRYINIKY